MSILAEGRYGEVLGRLWLISKGYKPFQPDWVAHKNGKYITLECKYQEKYKPPPFLGHGLPKWEIYARLKFQERFKIRAILLIIDKPTKEIFWQYLDILELGKWYDTQGKNPRRIYPLTNFIKEPPIKEE